MLPSKTQRTLLSVIQTPTHPHQRLSRELANMLMLLLLIRMSRLMVQMAKHSLMLLQAVTKSLYLLHKHLKMPSQMQILLFSHSLLVHRLSTRLMVLLHLILLKPTSVWVQPLMRTPLHLTRLVPPMMFSAIPMTLLQQTQYLVQRSIPIQQKLKLSATQHQTHLQQRLSRVLANMQNLS